MSSIWDVDVNTPVDPSDNWEAIKLKLQVFFPQYFNSEDPSYVDPAVLDELLLISNEARPWCLPTDRANLAQAMYVAYLISVRNETTTGQSIAVRSGPITSEREGDLAVTYAAPNTGSSAGMSKRPSSDPWDAWYRLYSLCSRGSITTRFGDPCPR